MELYGRGCWCAEAQLAKVLIPEAGSVGATNGWGAADPSMRSPLHAPSHDPAAAAAMQALLISGRKAEALRCIEIVPAITL